MTDRHPISHPGVWTNVFYLVGGLLIIWLAWDWSPWFVAAGFGEIALAIGSTWMHTHRKPGLLMGLQRPDLHAAYAAARAADHVGMVAHFVPFAVAFWAESGLPLAPVVAVSLLSFAALGWWGAGFQATSWVLAACGAVAVVGAVFALGAWEGAGIALPYAFAFMYQGSKGRFARPLGTEEPIHGVWHAITGLASPLALYTFLFVYAP